MIQPSGTAPCEITLHVPSVTDRTNLTAKIAQTGASIADSQSHLAYGTAVTLTGNFSAPVPYTVKAEDGTVKTYTVTVVVDKSAVKEITAFSF